MNVLRSVQDFVDAQRSCAFDFDRFDRLLSMCTREICLAELSYAKINNWCKDNQIKICTSLCLMVSFFHRSKILSLQQSHNQAKQLYTNLKAQKDSLKSKLNLTSQDEMRLERIQKQKTQAKQRYKRLASQKNRNLSCTSQFLSMLIVIFCFLFMLNFPAFSCIFHVVV